MSSSAKVWDNILPGALATAIGTGATEIAYRKSGDYKEALAVSVAGGIITSVFTYIADTVIKAQPQPPPPHQPPLLPLSPPPSPPDYLKIVMSMLISSIGVYIVSELVHRRQFSMTARAIIVGATGGTLWVLTRVLTQR